CAWCAPEEKGFLIAGLHGSSQMVASYLTLRRELMTKYAEPPPSVFKPGEAGPKPWKDTLRQQHIRYVVLNVGLKQKAEQALRYFIEAPESWSLVYLTGSVAIFAWKDPEVKDNPFAGMQIDLDQLAFQPAAD